MADVHEMTALVRELTREQREALIEAAQWTLRELEKGYRMARGGRAKNNMHDDGSRHIHAELPALFGSTVTLDLAVAVGRCQERLRIFETACHIEEEERRRAEGGDDGH